MNQTLSIRLNKYISDSGLCSRREADRHIEQGKVFINGKRALVGQQVTRNDKVSVNGHIIESEGGKELVFLAFNKPVGITSTTEAEVRDNIIDYVNHSDRIFPIGRLDKDSQGLIFLTNNGDMVNKILRAGNKHEKEYLVTVDKPITAQFLRGMSEGVPLLGEMTKKCKVVEVSIFIFKIILIQGLNRQIRRMCEHFNFEVVKLERVRIMNINLANLPLGEWRQLTEQELAGIFKMLTKSSSVVKKTKKIEIPEKEKVRVNEDKRKKPTNYLKIKVGEKGVKTGNSFTKKADVKSRPINKKKSFKR